MAGSSNLKQQRNTCIGYFGIWGPSLRLSGHVSNCAIPAFDLWCSLRKRLYIEVSGLFGPVYEMVV